jgi:hypothetical protein
MFASRDDELAGGDKGGRTRSRGRATGLGLRWLAIPPARQRSRDAENREIVRLGAAAGEDQTIATRGGDVNIEKLGNLLASILDNATRLLAGTVLARAMASTTSSRVGVVAL